MHLKEPAIALLRLLNLDVEGHHGVEIAVSERTQPLVMYGAGILIDGS
jgi:hypothetical protein